MSYTVTKLVLDIIGLTPTEKAVAHSLAWHAHEDGTNAFPSMQTIAREAGMNRRNAQKVVRRLEAKGLIMAEGSKSGGRFKATSYRFNLALGNSVSTDALLNSVSTDGASHRDRKGVATDQKGRRYERPKGNERSKKDHQQGLLENPKPEPALIPDWIPQGAWDAFTRMRIRTKHPLNSDTISIIVSKLDEYRKLGMPPKAVLEQSIENDWRGVFPLGKKSPALRREPTLPDIDVAMRLQRERYERQQREESERSIK